MKLVFEVYGRDGNMLLNFLIHVWVIIIDESENLRVNFVLLGFLKLGFITSLLQKVNLERHNWVGCSS